MSYFNTNETFFVIPLNTNDEEIKKNSIIFDIFAFFLFSLIFSFYINIAF